MRWLEKCSGVGAPPRSSNSPPTRGFWAAAQPGAGGDFAPRAIWSCHTTLRGRWLSSAESATCAAPRRGSSSASSFARPGAAHAASLRRTLPLSFMSPTGSSRCGREGALSVTFSAMAAWNTAITQPWGVSAFGQGDVHAEPDYAILRVAINRIDNQPRDALAAARDGASSVRAAVRHLGVPETDVMSSRMSVSSSWDNVGRGRQFIGHQCRVEFAVRLTDLDLVDEALVALVDAGADEIRSVHYDTTQQPQLRATARRAAVEAARRKAELYAEAAGASLGPVVHIDDVDPGNLSGDTHSMARAVAMLSGGGDLAPGQLTVSAAVVLGFSLVH